MALVVTATVQSRLAELPPEVQDEVRAKAKWVYSNHDDVALTPVAGSEAKKACLFQVKGVLYHAVFDFRAYPPNLYLVAVGEPSPTEE